MKYNELINFLKQYISNSSKGKMICIINKNEHESFRLAKRLKKNEHIYTVGESKKTFFHKMTVYEELLEILGDEDKVLSYAKKRELSPSRICRPISSLSSEKWRTGIAIGLLSRKKIFFISYISLEVVNMYWKKWMGGLFQECIDSGITIVFNTSFDLSKDINFDVILKAFDSVRQ